MITCQMCAMKDGTVLKVNRNSSANLAFSSDNNLLYYNIQ